MSTLLLPLVAALGVLAFLIPRGAQSEIRGGVAASARRHGCGAGGVRGVRVHTQWRRLLRRKVDLRRVHAACVPHRHDRAAGFAVPRGARDARRPKTECATGPSRAAGAAQDVQSASASLPASSLFSCAFVQHRLPGTNDGRRTVDYVWLQRWAAGRQRAGNKLGVYLARTGAVPSNRPAIIVPAASRSASWGASFYAAALSGDLGAMSVALRSLSSAKLTPSQLSYGTGRSPALTAALRLAATLSPRPPTIVVGSETLARDLAAALAKAPAVQASVVYSPGLAAADR